MLCYAIKSLYFFTKLSRDITNNTAFKNGLEKVHIIQTFDLQATYLIH